MLAFNKKLFHIFASITIIFWVALPKFTLIEIPGFEQGIRFEDLCFIITLVMFFLYGYKKNQPILIGGRAGSRFLIYLLLSSVGSMIVISPTLNSIIFSLRWLEYFLMGNIIVYIINHATQYNYKKWIKYFFTFNIILASYWYANNGFNFRFAGLSEGPWEISSIIIFLYIGTYNSFSKRDKFIYGLLAVFIIFLAQARIQALAILAVFIFDKDFRKIFFNKYSAALLITTLIIFHLEIIKIMRLEEIGWDSVAKLIDIAKDIDADSNFYSLASNNPDVDAPMIGRLIIWSNFIYIWLDAGLYGIIFGIGPGRGGVVVDGFYIRLITEFGLVGIYLFYAALKNILKPITHQDKLKIYIVLHIIFFTNDIFTSQRGFASFCVAIALLYKSSNLIKNGH